MSGFACVATLIMLLRMTIQRAGRSIAVPRGGGTGGRVGRGAKRTRELVRRNNETIGELDGQGNDQEYDRKGGAIVYTRWIEKMESVQDMSGRGDGQKKSSIRSKKQPPQHPRIVYPSILDINYFCHFLYILRNYDPIDDEPMWADDCVVAPTPGVAITIPETANEFAIKGNHLTLIKGGGTGRRVGRGARGTREPVRRNNETIGELDGQGNDQGVEANGGNQGNNQGNNKNKKGDAVNDNIQGDVRSVIMNNGRRGCSYKDFLACNPKAYDRKGGAIVYTHWIEKLESV
uniref:Reverse transcriptase domain-containing protein n=1 Tax=Tanacetum cinerariifolium TaxID=118510 RepID=A0A6L2NQH2_TANCI|nr:reverse transcriptase domain-containing protein [Tanacetum cinerariifolium]